MTSHQSAPPEYTGISGIHLGYTEREREKIEKSFKWLLSCKEKRRKEAVFEAVGRKARNLVKKQIKI